MSAALIWTIVALVWIVGGILAYRLVLRKWDNSTFEKFWFSAVWPTLIPLFLIHLAHNGGHDGSEK